MAIKLVSAPTIKITLTCDELFEELYPNYYFADFKLTKKLLEPNCLVFKVVKNDLSLDSDDIGFMMKDDLLGAKVECSLSAHRYDYYEDEWVEDKVEKFFYGYIQNIKVERSDTRVPLTFICTAYSPDARLKHFPSCCTFNEYTLRDCVLDVLNLNAGEQTVDFKEGEYPEIEGLNADVNPHYTSVMPYTVQYNESPYDFLKRLAMRYGEFFYYEDGEVVFGKVKEKEIVPLHSGFDLEEYSYDLNMNHHTGIVFAEHNHFVDANFASGIEKYANQNTGDELWESGANPKNDMARAAFEGSTGFFNDNYNAIHELGNAPFEDKPVSILCPNTQNPEYANYPKEMNYELRDLLARKQFAEENNFEEYSWTNFQRNLLDCYVAADSLICTGKAGRADLKLGSVIGLMDETNTTFEKEDWIEHDSLVVIELTYEWNKEYALQVINTFKAMAKDSPVPPYLKRDDHGFLNYNDFDVYPKSGPQHGIVVENSDPCHLGRVKVVLLWQHTYGRCEEGENYLPYAEKKQCTPWIWTTSQYAGYFHGTHVVPELGDQVIVGFEHDNVERPYVMGSVSSQNGFHSAVNHDLDQRNNIKAFRTRSGHSIAIYDDLSNDWKKTGYVEITDTEKQRYKITLSIDDSVIRLESKGNIELIAGNNIVMKAGNNIQMEARQDIISKAENDINTTAEHNMVDNVNHNMISRVSNHRDVVVGKEYLVYMRDNNENEIRMNEDHIVARMSPELGLSLEKRKGIIGLSDTNIEFSGKRKVGMESTQDVILKSDQKIDINSEIVEMEGKTMTAIRGKITKIN